MSNKIYDEAEIMNDPEVQELTHEQYTQYKASCETVIEQAKQVKRLSENPDFIAIIMELYFVGEPQRLAGLMASGKITDKIFDDCASDLKGIGSIRAFLSDFVQKGIVAQDELDNVNIAWNEAVANGSVA